MASGGGGRGIDEVAPFRVFVGKDVGRGGAKELEEEEEEEE